MDLIGIFCGIIFAVVSFGLLAIVALFISCDLAADRMAEYESRKRQEEGKLQ